jgi:hypothetical protein
MATLAAAQVRTIVSISRVMGTGVDIFIIICNRTFYIA